MHTNIYIFKINKQNAFTFDKSLYICSMNILLDTYEGIENKSFDSFIHYGLNYVAIDDNNEVLTISEYQILRKEEVPYEESIEYLEKIALISK